MDKIRRSTRPRAMKRKSDILYFDDQKIELNEEERDLLYPCEKPREKKYCFCKRTEEETIGLHMIECDTCHDWFHDICIGITHEEMEQIEEYHCPACSSKPSKAQKRSQPSHAEIELLLAALAYIDEERPKIQKRELRVSQAKISLFHFNEPITTNRYSNVVGFIKNDSSSAVEENKLIVPIRKEDLKRGSVWTSWGNYKIAMVDGRIQVSSDLSFRSPSKLSEEKSESPVQGSLLSVEDWGDSFGLVVREGDVIELPKKNMRFEFDQVAAKRVLDAMKCHSFEKMKEMFNNHCKYRPAAIIKVPVKSA